MILFPLVAALHPLKASYDLRKLTILLFGISLVILIGLRHEVGGDWDRYIEIYDFHKGVSLNFENFISGDYGYEAIHWFSLNYLNGVYSTNLICAIFFVSGLIRLSSRMPLPWVALLVSINFLVIVVAMGYTRQAAAVGFLMWALVDLLDGKKIKFFVYIIIGSTFHKTLLGMSIVGLFYNNITKETIFLFIFILLILLAGYFFFLKEKLLHMLYYYIEIDFHHSRGALIRTILNSFSALVFFIYRGKYRKVFNDERVWLYFSIVSIALVPAAYFYSTFADRVAIYFLFIQLVILSRVPVLILSVYWRTVFVVGVATAYLLALLTWLFFGVHSVHWLPYQNLITVI